MISTSATIMSTTAMSPGHSHDQHECDDHEHHARVHDAHECDDHEHHGH